MLPSFILTEASPLFRRKSQPRYLGREWLPPRALRRKICSQGLYRSLVIFRNPFNGPSTRKVVSLCARRKIELPESGLKIPPHKTVGVKFKCFAKASCRHGEHYAFVCIAMGFSERRRLRPPPPPDGPRCARRPGFLRFENQFQAGI